MYSVDLKNVVPQGGLTCLFAKSTPNESNLWHRRIGHVNFKTMNKLEKMKDGTEETGKEGEVNVVDPKSSNELPNDLNMPELEDIVYLDDDEDVGAEADMNNLDAFMLVSPIPTTRIHKIIQLNKIIRDLNSTQKDDKELEPKKVWTLVDLPHGKKAIGTKWVYRNKKDERGIMIRNNARLVAQGYTQEEGINYGEVFALVARIEAIRLFLAYASFKDFVVYYMDVKSTFLYGKIEKEVYVCQPPGFEDPYIPNRVYKVEKVSMVCIKLLELGLQVKKKEDGIFISQDKYVTEILKKFSFSDVKTASTPMETHKPLLKDADGEDIDEHMYRSMIGSLMYLTSSRPDIMFVVCVCARFQVNPKVSHLHAVKRIFRYLKGQPKLGLWYPKDSPFDLVAYTDSDYAGASLDRKSTTGGCQFLGCRLISWQCKKQTVVANSTTEAEYIAASNCCGQVLWIQNQLLDYGYNFMQTKIHIDNESTICIVKNLVFYSKTKNIEIRHHFIRDSNEKKLIQIIKIHTEQNVIDLLTKAFDRIIHKGWLEWNATPAKDRIGVKTDIGEGSGHPTDPQHTSRYAQPFNEEQITAPSSSQPKNTYKCRKPKKVTEIPKCSEPTNLVTDEVVHEERRDSVEMAATTATHLDAEQDSGGRPRRQETIGDKPAQTRVLDLETTKTSQAKEIVNLKKRVKKL
ncbi:putative ribonuclease H-like domain-containing protein [Tanacetum coccineum]